jgi:hypothetical protein
MPRQQPQHPLTKLISRGTTMAVNEYECANDLLGRDVFLTRRVQNFEHEVWCRVVAVRGSVPFDWDSGELDVVVTVDGRQERYTFDLSMYCAERISE